MVFTYSIFEAMSRCVFNSQRICKAKFNALYLKTHYKNEYENNRVKLVIAKSLATCAFVGDE